MNNQSHYKTQYGGSNSPQKPKDTDAMKYKSFGQLHIVSILKPEVLKIIEHWLRINDVDEFKRRIYKRGMLWIFSYTCYNNEWKCFFLGK